MAGFGRNSFVLTIGSSSVTINAIVLFGIFQPCFFKDPWDSNDERTCIFLVRVSFRKLRLTTLSHSAYKYFVQTRRLSQVWQADDRTSWNSQSSGTPMRRTVSRKHQRWRWLASRRKFESRPTLMANLKRFTSNSLHLHKDPLITARFNTNLHERQWIAQCVGYEWQGNCEAAAI